MHGFTAPEERSRSSTHARRPQVPDPYWNSGGTNREPAGYTDAWNRQIPSTDQGTLEYLQMARM